MKQPKLRITLGLVLLAIAAMVVGGGVAWGQSHKNLKNTIKNQGANTRTTVRNQSTNIQTEVGAQHTTTQGVIDTAQTAIQGTVQTESTTVQNAIMAHESEMTAHHDMIKQVITAIELGITSLQTAVTDLEPGAPAGPLCGAGTEGQRFVVDGTAVCDNDTGLFWQQTPGAPPNNGTSCGNTTPCTWQQAVNYCVALAGGYRLPEVKELISLVDYTEGDPATALDTPPNGPFSNVQSSIYWSATSNASNSTFAWNVFFFNGNVFTNNLTNTNFVWCARSGS